MTTTHFPINSNRQSAVRSRANLKGDTTTKMLVHSLALSLVQDDRVQDIDFVRGPFAGQTKQVAQIDASDLRAVVGGALADGTFRSILRNHPALTLSTDKRIVSVIL